MAEETVQIKQEPLDIIYAAEIADIDDAAITTSGGGSSVNSSMKGSENGADRGACNLLNDIGDASTVGFSNNVTIKIEPNIDAYAEENYSGGIVVVGCSGVTAQKLLGETGNKMSDVQVKAEPVDDNIVNGFELSPTRHNLSNATHNSSELQHTSCNDFQVVNEHDNIITISASDLSPENRYMEFKQKLQAINELSCLQNYLRPRRTKKCFTCKLCAKRCYQDKHFEHHMEQHRRNRMFCTRKMCDTWFSSLEDCERHEFESHDIQQLKCNVCNHKFREYEQLSVHKIKMHSKLHRFVCSLCRDWFISLVELQEHWTYLPEACGRLSNIDLLEKSYKLKSAPTTDSAGLRLRLQPSMLEKQPHLVAEEQMNGIEIKQEPIEPESILPDDIPTQNNINSSEKKYQVVAQKFASNKNSLAAPQFKLRLRKQPLSPPRTEADRSPSPSPTLANPNPLGQLLARRITSKFSLKTVPKMFNLINKANEIKPQQNVPPIAPQPFTKWQSNSNVKDAIAVPDEPPQKIQKLATNFTIVKLKSNIQKQIITSNALDNSVATNSDTNMSSTNAEQNPEINQIQIVRQFTVQSVPVPPLDKAVAAAKLESVTKANRELTLTELLDEAIVREKNASNENTLNAIKGVEQKAVEIRAEEIKTELVEDMTALQNEDSSSAANLSDSSLGSSSIPLMHTNYENDSEDLPPQRSRSLPAKEIKETHFPKSDNGDGYICPKCGRRYSTIGTVQEHLNSNCGRNLRHECDVCHKCFFSMSTLNCHRTIHTGVLPHKCNYCDKRFRTRGQVTVHHRTHTGERPFVCEICSQSFTHRETLISHLSRHIGMKRYKCYGCNKQFSCISGLSMHRVTRPDTCGKFELNTRAIGPRVRVIRGRVVFEPQPAEPEDDNDDDMDGAGMNGSGLSADKATHHQTEVLSEIQNK